MLKYIYTTFFILLIGNAFSQGNGEMLNPIYYLKKTEKSWFNVSEVIKPSKISYLEDMINSKPLMIHNNIKSVTVDYIHDWGESKSEYKTVYYFNLEGSVDSIIDNNYGGNYRDYYRLSYNKLGLVSLLEIINLDYEHNVIDTLLTEYKYNNGGNVTNIAYRNNFKPIHLLIEYKYDDYERVTYSKTKWVNDSTNTETNEYLYTDSLVKVTSYGIDSTNKTSINYFFDENGVVTSYSVWDSTKETGKSIMYLNQNSALKVHSFLGGFSGKECWTYLLSGLPLTYVSLYKTNNSETYRLITNNFNENNLLESKDYLTIEEDKEPKKSVSKFSYTYWNE